MNTTNMQSQFKQEFGNIPNFRNYFAPAEQILGAFQNKSFDLNNNLGDFDQRIDMRSSGRNSMFNQPEVEFFSGRQFETHDLQDDVERGFISSYQQLGQFESGIRRKFKSTEQVNMTGFHQTNDQAWRARDDMEQGPPSDQAGLMEAVNQLKYINDSVNNDTEIFPRLAPPNLLFDTKPKMLGHHQSEEQALQKLPLVQEIKFMEKQIIQAAPIKDSGFVSSDFGSTKSSRSKRIYRKRTDKQPRGQKSSFAPVSKQIQPVSEKEKARQVKLRSYLHKKYTKHLTTKHLYVCRQEVAEKRLRIKGRFVTREQAFEILGLTQTELLKNDRIQQLLTQHAQQDMKVNSTVEGVRVRNFQALIDNNYSHKNHDVSDSQSVNLNLKIMTNSGHKLNVAPSFIAYQENTFPDFIAPLLFTLQRNESTVQESGKNAREITNPLRTLDADHAVNDCQPQI